jgi:hypothetical protein
MRWILMKGSRWFLSTAFYRSPVHCLVLGKEVQPPPHSDTEAAPNHDRGRVFNHGDSVLLEVPVDGAGLSQMPSWS